MENDITIELKHSNTLCQIKTYIYLFIKRTFDIFIGLLGTILLIPITVTIKLAYILTKDYAPIFFKQTRIGKNGKEFKLYKFRTMIPDADKELEKMLKQKKYREEWQENHKFSKDPRITKVGNILRISSLDELPQVFNVLKGDMSMIGPRPLVKGELDEHGGNHKIYESVRPGITGWWACNGRSSLTYKERLNLEYYYIKHKGIILDIKCVFKTIAVIFTKRGAK